MLLPGCGLPLPAPPPPPPPIGSLTSSGGLLGQWSYVPVSCFQQKLSAGGYTQADVQFATQSKAAGYHSGVPWDAVVRVSEAGGVYTGTLILINYQPRIRNIELNAQTCSTFAFTPAQLRTKTKNADFHGELQFECKVRDSVVAGSVHLNRCQH